MPENAHRYKLLTGARLIDGTGGPPIDTGAVLTHGSRVAAVGPAATVSAPDGASVERFDYPGKTIMPGMVDCHTHHNGFGDGRSGDDLSTLPDEVLTRPDRAVARLNEGRAFRKGLPASVDLAFELFILALEPRHLLLRRLQA